MQNAKRREEHEENRVLLKSCHESDHIPLILYNAMVCQAITLIYSRDPCAPSALACTAPCALKKKKKKKHLTALKTDGILMKLLASSNHAKRRHFSLPSGKHFLYVSVAIWRGQNTWSKKQPNSFSLNLSTSVEKKKKERKPKLGRSNSKKEDKK